MIIELIVIIIGLILLTWFQLDLNKEARKTQATLPQPTYFIPDKKPIRCRIGIHKIDHHAPKDPEIFRYCKFCNQPYFYTATGGIGFWSRYKESIC